jgi:hypothetical protein
VRVVTDERRIDGRRAVLYGAPLLYLVLGLIHPHDLEVGDAMGQGGENLTPTYYDAAKEPKQI